MLMLPGDRRRCTRGPAARDAVHAGSVRWWTSARLDLVHAGD